MRLLILFIISISIFGCGENDTSSQYEQSGKIVYIKDNRTGLCYASLDAMYSRSITCVPCDSLMKIGIK